MFKRGNCLKILKKIKWGLFFVSALGVVGASAQVMDTSVRDRIYAAAAAGDVSELKRLEGLGYSLEMTDANGNTPYCQAVWSQNRAAVSALIAAGASVKPRCLRRIPYVTESRIYASAHAEDLEQLVAWKKEGLNVDVVNPETGNSALCDAVYNYDCPAIQALLRAGAQQAQPCMRRVPQEVRDKLQCRPLKIDWGIVGYSLVGAGMAGALVAVLAGGGSSGHPTCEPQQRWNGDRCVSCPTCWIGKTCISEEMMNDKKRPYYRDETTAACWQVSPAPIKLTDAQLKSQAAKISTWENDFGDVPYQKGNYLPQINAAEAYARGYTGYMVERTSPNGRPSNGTFDTPSVSKNKVTVAVYSSGMTIGSGGTVTSTDSSSSSSTQKKTSVWNWTGVNQAFYDKSKLSDEEVTYQPTGASSTTPSVTSLMVGNVGEVEHNLATSSSTKTPYGYNFDYGPCGTRTNNKRGDDDYTTNCYGVLNKTVGSHEYPFAVLYGNGADDYLYVIKDPTTGIVNGYTSTEPTKEVVEGSDNPYVDYYNDGKTGLYDKFFGELKYDQTTTTVNSVTTTTYYTWTPANGAAYDDDPSPHYTVTSDTSYTNRDMLIGSKGTFLAGIVAAMKQDEGQTYGVAYNAAVLPVNRDVAYGISSAAMKVMLNNAQVVLLDEGYTSTYLDSTNDGVDNGSVMNDALSAFTYDSTNQTYTVRKMNELFGSDKADAYTLVGTQNGVVVVANGNAQDTSTHYKQPSLQAAIPLMNGFNNVNYNETTWKIGDILPTIKDSNPLYHRYLTVGAVQKKQIGDETYYNLESYSQPCGIAASYCLVAPGGQSATELGSASGGIYSTTDPSKAGAPVDDAYNYSYGTSSAAAVVAGALAVLMGAYPHLTAQQAVAILLQTAHYLDATDMSEAAASSAYLNYYGAVNYEGYDYELKHKYNSIFGYGLVDLAAATDPIGGMNGLWVYKTGTAVGAGTAGVVTAAATSMMAPASLMGSLSSSLTSALPSAFVAFDAYNRPFLYPTANLFQFQNRRKAKSWNDFKMFMHGRDPIEVQPTENFSMTYRDQTHRVSSSSQIPLGLMQATLKQDKVKYSLFYSQDTTLGNEAYWKRRQVNPFIQMRDAYGVSSSYQFNPKWSVEVGWTMGRNGFFDEDDRRFDAPDNRMQAFTNSIVFKPVNKVALKVASGIMKENGSSLGMVSSGAFGIKGADTQFVGAGMEFSPIDKVHFEAMYYYGQTKTKAKQGLMNMSKLMSDSFALTASYKPTEDHLFGVQLSSPLRIRKGTLNVSLPVGRHPTEDIYYYNTYHANMKPKARELDLSMYYQGNMTQDLSLQGELGVRLNPDHQADVAPDYRGMVGVKWNY